MRLLGLLGAMTAALGLIVSGVLAAYGNVRPFYVALMLVLGFVALIGAARIF